MYDNKNTASKAAIKRNLFGEQNEYETSTTLANQLTESLRCRPTCSSQSVLNPIVKSAKCNEFEYEMQEIVTGTSRENNFVVVIMHSVSRFQHKSLFTYLLFLTCSMNIIFFQINCLDREHLEMLKFPKKI